MTLPPRPIGTEFSVLVQDTDRQRIFRRYKVVGHELHDGNLFEVVEPIETIYQPKVTLGGEEKKA